MTQSTLRETFVQKSNEFYDLLREQCGDPQKATAQLKLILSNGYQASEKIHELELVAIKEAAERQAKFLNREGWIRGGMMEFIYAAERTCDTVERFQRLSALWKELYRSNDWGPVITATTMRDVLHDKLELDS